MDEKLTESLHCFQKLMNEIRYINLSLETAKSSIDIANPKIEDITIYLCLYNMAILKTRCYLDEYNKHFTIKKISKYRQRVRDVKEICQPAITQIDNLWPELTTYRNLFVSHGYRDLSGIYKYKTLAEIQTAGTMGELLALSAIVLLIHTAIKREFATEYEHVEGFHTKGGVAKTSVDYTKDEITDIVFGVAEKMNQVCEKRHKGYRLPF